MAEWLMAEGQGVWPIETIALKDQLYIRLCDFHFRKGSELVPTAFRPRPTDRGRKSAYWCKYVTMDDVLDDTDNEKCNSKCASLAADEIRSVDLSVEHSPLNEKTNMARAHSEYHTNKVLETDEGGEEIEYEPPTNRELQKLVAFAQKRSIYSR